MKDVRLVLVAVAVFALTAFGVAYADSGNDAPTTQATTWHGAPANTPGFDGTAGQPNGGDPGNSNGIHNVGPGQAAAYAKAVDGDPPSCQFHGGFQGEKKNC